MSRLLFSKELYSKTALIKAAYNFTDKAYLHLDADEKHYIVTFEMKNENDLVSEKDFENEMLAQSVRHEIYLQTKNIRELIMARAMATSVIAEINESFDVPDEQFSEDKILKDWFSDD